MKKRLVRDAGFSLVELIVVVLIMGILAVLLAPQVMKYVGRSQKNMDEYEANAIKSAVLTSIGEYESQGNELMDSVYNVTRGGVVVSGNDQNTGLTSIINSYMGEYPQVRDQSGKVYQIRCWQDGKKVDVVITDGTY